MSTPESKPYSTSEKITIFFLMLVFFVFLNLYNFKVFIYPVILAYSSLVFPKYRKYLLLGAGLLVAFLNPQFADAPLRFILISLACYYLFNILFILMINKFNLHQMGHFRAMLAVFLLIAFYFLLIKKVIYDYTSYYILLSPVIYTYWTYVFYIQSERRNENYLTQILWMRPFWFVWMIPFGTIDETYQILNRPNSAAEVIKRLQKDLVILALFSVGLYLFENLLFGKPYYTQHFPIYFSKGVFVYTHSDGFYLQKNFNNSQLIAVVSQILSTIHFIGNTFLYSTMSLVTATFAGGLLKPAVSDFWNARTFNEFYLKSSHYNSVLIRSGFLKPLVFKTNKIKNHHIKLFVTVFLSVFVVSSILMVWGRGVRFQNNFLTYEWFEFVFSNLQYPILSGLACASSQLIFKFYPERSDQLAYKIARVGFYLVVSSFLLIFIFHYKISDFSLKTDYLRFIFNF